MARVPKKTYSRKNCELQGLTENEKEVVDPFDELLSSPLKQDVDFKPLSFWEKKLKKSEQERNLSKGNYKLYEFDDSFSPYKSKKKLKRKPVKERSGNEIKKSGPETSKNDSFWTDSFYNFEKHANNPRLHKGKNLVKTGPPNYDGYVTIRRPLKQLNVNVHVSPVANCSRRRNGMGDSVESANGCERGQENESYDVVKREAAVRRESETCSKIPEHVCKSSTGYYVSSPVGESRRIWNDSLMSDSLELYRTERDSDSDECEPFLINSKTIIICEEMRCPTGSVLEQHLNDITYVIDVERTELKDAEKELVPESDSLQLGDVSDLTEMISNMTMSNETLEDSTIVNSSPESSHEERQAGLRLEELPMDDEKENCNPQTGVELRNVTRRRAYANTKEQFVSNVKSAKSGKNSNRDTLRKTQQHLDQIEDQDSVYSNFTKPSLEVSETLKCPGYKDEINLDSSRFSMFAPPIFESTRFIDDASEKEVSNIQMSGQERLTNWGDMLVPDAELSFFLKSGKKWQRSMSVLKQLQNGNFSLDVNKVRGRRFEKFMQETLEMQNDNPYFSTSVSNMTISNDTLINKTLKRESSVMTDRKSSLLESALDDTSISEDEENETVVAFDHEQSKETSVLKTFSGPNRTYMNRTAKVIPTETSLEKPSLFMSALGLQTERSIMEESLVGESRMEDEGSAISPRDFILLQCGQEDVLPFEEYFNERTLKNCKKIGEGVYGEVFMYNSDTVLKIIPIEGEDHVNGEPQKKFEEILSEVVIASSLSNLRNGERNRTSGFSEMKKCWCVVGKYPKFLLDLWDEYDQSGSGSENDSPVMFKSDQLYIILELANGGKDLEAFVFNSAEQSVSIFVQAAFSLAVAEKAFEFEHRDLHWGNLLIAHTKEKIMSVVLDGVEYKIPTKGVKVSIIDFTLSRMSHEGCCIFNDLSVDPSLFISQGDYQFEIYRMMQKELKNDWSQFRPRNNIFWLHYTIDKMLKMVRYKNKNTQVHKKSMKELKILESVILEYNDSSEFAINQELV